RGHEAAAAEFSRDDTHERGGSLPHPGTPCQARLRRFLVYPERLKPLLAAARGAWSGHWEHFISARGRQAKASRATRGPEPPGAELVGFEIARRTHELDPTRQAGAGERHRHALGQRRLGGGQPEPE